MSDIAYSYIRFSSNPQEAGDSVRRQTEDFSAWAKRAGVTPDTSLSIDKGISAFKGRNADLGSLGEFLRLVEAGRIAKGSYLVVESLDRLTRDDIQPALRLLLGLLQSGVRIVQLRPVETVYDDKSDVTALILAIVELSRGHSESRVKSVRGLAVRKRQREDARRGERVAQRHPQWVRREGGEYVLIPERAAIVRRIFHLAASGMGASRIVATLTREQVEPFGKAEAWSRTYVYRIIKDRRAVGEYQPKGPGRKPEGDPVQNYYPAVVPVNEYQRAYLALIERKRFKGREARHVTNVFGGLLVNAKIPGDVFCLCGHKTVSAGRPGERRYAILANRAGKEGRATFVSMPYEAFEGAILAHLAELPAADIIGNDQGGGELLAMTTELEEIDTDLAMLRARLAVKASPTLAQVAEAKDDRREAVVKRIAELRAEAASPLSAAWADSKTLYAALLAAEDKEAFRSRLRSALRRIVASIHVLMVPRGKARDVVAQVRFHGSEARRNYLICYRQGMVGPGGERLEAEAKSWSLVEMVPVAADIDLTRPNDVEWLEQRLLSA